MNTYSATVRLLGTSPLRRSRAVALALSLGVALAACGTSGPALRTPLTFLGNIQLPRDTGAAPSIDLLAIDPAAGRLYIPHTSRNALDIVSLSSGRVERSITGLPGIKAVAAIDGSTVFSSDAGDGTVAVLDPGAGRVLERIDVGESPDAIEYDRIRDQVVVSLPASHRIVLIERQSRKVSASINLPGTPELMAVDSESARLFVAINDKNEVAVVELGTHVVNPLYRGCDLNTPTGIAYDAAQSRLFVASQGAINVIDVLLEQCLGVVDTGRSVDQIELDAGTHHLYAPSAASGNVAVIDLVSRQPLGVTGTAPGAKGIAVDLTKHRLYIAVAHADLVAVYHDP